MHHDPRSSVPAARFRRGGLLRLALLGALAFASAQASTNPAGLIAYVDADGRTAVRDPREGGPPAVFGGGLERAQFPAWSSDGNRLAVIVDQYARSHRLWSPDSDALVMPALDDDGAVQLVVFGVDGDVTPIGHGDMPAWNVR